MRENKINMAARNGVGERMVATILVKWKLAARVRRQEEAITVSETVSAAGDLCWTRHAHPTQ